MCPMVRPPVRGAQHQSRRHPSGCAWAGVERRLLSDIVGAWSDSPLTLNAQSHLEGLYGSFGFTPNGPRFDEDGLEHTPMERPAG